MVKEKAKHLHVVNDLAERGVKLTSDYLCTAKSDNTFQNVLQTVEINSKNVPNLRNSKNKMSCPFDLKHV